MAKMCALVWGLAATVAWAAPEATVAPATWELDFTFHDPQRISMQLPGNDHPTTFWYMLYEVTNNTGREVELYPSFRLMTDTVQIVEGGENISPTVYDAIQTKHEKEYPFFISPWKLTGPVLQGQENSRASAVVFRMFDKEASRFTIFVAGLSGDVVRVLNPSAGPDKPPTAENPPYFILRRTLAIHYDLPGDPRTRVLANPIRREREWVMR